jgi:Cd2+/Zn2+-exporting ATPase
MQKQVEEVQEISGHRLRGRVDGREVLAGDARLLKQFGIPYDSKVEAVVETIALVAIDGQYAGYLTTAGQLRPPIKRLIRQGQTDLLPVNKNVDLRRQEWGG